MSLQRVAPSHLMDKHLYDFKTFEHLLFTPDSTDPGEE